MDISAVLASQCDGIMVTRGHIWHLTLKSNYQERILKIQQLDCSRIERLDSALNILL